VCFFDKQNVNKYGCHRNCNEQESTLQSRLFVGVVGDLKNFENKKTLPWDTKKKLEDRANAQKKISVVCQVPAKNKYCNIQIRRKAGTLQETGTGPTFLALVWNSRAAFNSVRPDCTWFPVKPTWYSTRSTSSPYRYERKIGGECRDGNERGNPPKRETPRKQRHQRLYVQTFNIH
jgi:hypothetical protein